MLRFVGVRGPVRWVALALLGLLAVACGSTATTGGSSATQPAAKKIVNLEYYLTTPPGSADNFWIPVAKELGYFAEEGIDVTPITAEGAAAAVSAGRGDFAITTPVALVSAAASGNPLSLVIVYPWARRLHTVIGVPPGSAIKSFKDMKGARIAVHNFQQSQYVAMRAVLRMNGLDPDKDVQFIVIPAGPAQLAALNRKEVDVIASFDTQLAQMENLGMVVSPIALPPSALKAFGSAFGFRRDYLDKYPERVIGFGRACAKATVFTQANPDAAVRLLWKYYPDSKPKDVTEEKAMEVTRRAMKARLDNAVLHPSDEVQQYGYTPLTGFQAWLELDSSLDKGVDLKTLFDNRFVKEINNFDSNAIVKQALAFKS